MAGSKWNPNKVSGAAGGGMPAPRPLSAHLTTLHFALKAVEELMDAGGFLPDTKAQFALRMNWTNGMTSSGVDIPDRRRVENVCNLTRDQDQWPPISEALGGYVIVYSPSQGGMLLVDPTGEQPLDHLTQLLLGDLQKQQGIKTVNRRRLPTWKTAGAAAANVGDQELSRLFWQAEGEINTTGFVSDSTIGAVFKAARSRGLLGVTT